MGSQSKESRFACNFTGNGNLDEIRKIGVSFYDRWVLPRLINFAMTREDATRLRAAHVPAARGAVLEVGIGSGLNLPFYTSRVTHLYGVDSSAELLAMAKEKAAAAPFPVELVHGSADRLSLADASVDTVVVTWSLCSIANAAHALREMRRVLKPGGTLIFVEHGLSPDARRQEMAESSDAVLAPVCRRLSFESEDGRSGARRGIYDYGPAHGVRAGTARVHVHVRRPGTETRKRITNNEKRMRASMSDTWRTFDWPPPATPRQSRPSTGRIASGSVISFEETAPSAEEMARRIATIGATRPWIVLEDDGGVIGYAYASPHHDRAAYRWSVSTAIYIGRAHHRRGAGRALYTTLFALLRPLGYRQATAGITLPNPASVGLHAAFGFVPVGVYRHIGYKMGGWHDVGWYQAEIQPVSARSCGSALDS